MNENDKCIIPCFDEMFADAAKIVVKAKSASVSMFQRRLGVGFCRAGRIMDQLEKAGIVGAADGFKARKVLVPDSRELEKILASFTTGA